MQQSKKIGWVSVLFVLMFSLHSGIVAASDSTTLPFPGNGYVGVSEHTEIPESLAWMISGITQSDINHCWVTATVDGVQGVIHSDGVKRSDDSDGVHFLCWSDFLDTCKEGSIRLFKPHKKAIGFAELEGRGIDLSGIPPIFRKLLARKVGKQMINTWIQEMLAYSGVPYDQGFMPLDDEIYCSELLAHGWINTGSYFKLYSSKPASELKGWDVVPPGEDLTYGALFMLINEDFTEDTRVYDLIDIVDNVYFKEISVD